MTLRDERVLFTRLLVDLLLYMREWHSEAEVALDEGTVKSPRNVWYAGNKLALSDGVHRRGSRHHDGCAMDLLVYIEDQYIADGEHPIYRDMGLHWESLHDRAAWGGHFEDANHFSLAAEDGRK